MKNREWSILLEREFNEAVDWGTGKVLDTLGKLGLVIDGLMTATDIGIGWVSQDKENKKIDKVLAQYFNAQYMEAYQMSGAVFYVNDKFYIHGMEVDEELLDYLYNVFRRSWW